MISLKKKMVSVHEKFKPAGVRYLDSKTRISLGDKLTKVLLQRMKIDAFEILVGEQGDILLRPVAHLPSKESWIYQNPKVLKQVLDGLNEAKEGKMDKVVDLEKFLNDL